MSDPITLGAIIAVVADVATIISAAVTVIGWGTAILLFTLKLLLDLIAKTGFALLTTILVPLSGIFSPFVDDADAIINDLRSSRFDTNPPVRLRNVGAIGFIVVFETIITEIRMFITEIITYLSPLFFALPWLIPLAVLVALFAIFAWWTTSYVFLAVELSYQWAVISSQTIAYVGNYIFAFIVENEEAINAFAKLIIDLSKAVFGIFCSGSPYNGNPEHDCPLLWAVYLFAVYNFNYWYSLSTQLWAILVAIAAQMGSSICPGGTCPPHLCLKYMNVAECSWGFEFAFWLIGGILFDFVTIFYYVVIIMLLFAFDVMALTLANFYILLSRFIDPNFSSLLTSVAQTFSGGATTLETFVVPSTFVQFKQVWVFFKAVIGGMEYVLVQFIVTIGGLIDLLVCYFIRDPIQCLVSRLCFFTLRDFTISVDILGTIIDIPIPIRQKICVEWLGLSETACSYTCESCKVRPFNTVINVVWFYVSNLVHNGDAGAGWAFIPCNVASTCCNRAYTLITLGGLV
jgi:hypothetical protein